jgi:uncharacterized membrane protein YuzA (DUF378 family)
VAAIFGLDFGETNAATRIIYGLVGLSGLVLLISWLASLRHDDHDMVDDRRMHTASAR